MNMPLPANEQTPSWNCIHWAVWCLLGIGVALVVIDRWVPVLGVMPYLVLLACPLMQLFMHSNHGNTRHGDDNKKSQ